MEQENLALVRSFVRVCFVWYFIFIHFDLMFHWFFTQLLSILNVIGYRFNTTVCVNVGGFSLYIHISKTSVEEVLKLNAITTNFMPTFHI
jgi:hypothetical protein